MPFPSKACKTCRARHLKCDETRPFCKRCLKAGRLCTGFPNEPGGFTFLDENTYARGVARRPRKTSADTMQSLQENRSHELSIVHYIIQTPPSPHIERDQLFGNFTNYFLPDDGSQLSRAQRPLRSLLIRIDKTAGLQMLIQNANTAVMLAHLGRVNHSKVLRERARPFYGRALILLNKTLASKDALSDDTLLSTLMLAFYEILSPERHSNWIKHASAVSSLIKLRGPAMHREGFGRDLFLACREALILEALESCTTCFLQEEPWLDLLKELLDEGSAGPDGKLHIWAWTVFLEKVKLPYLMREVRHLQDLDDNRALERHHELLAELDSFRAKLGALFSHLLTDSPESLNHQWGYDEVGAACMKANYWNTMMITTQLRSSIDGTNAPILEAEIVELARNCYHMALNLGKCRFSGSFMVLAELYQMLKWTSFAVSAYELKLYSAAYRWRYD